MKTYAIEINMQWSEEYIVKAKSSGEARRKAWAKFKKNPPKKNFEFMSDKID